MEDYDVPKLTLCLFYPSSAYEDALLSAQDTLLVLQHSRHVLIKFRRLFVPHVLRFDANQRVEGFVEN